MQINTALLIIDMQNDFLLPGRPFYVNGARPTVPQIKKLLDFSRSNDWTVIHIIREHDKYGINHFYLRSMIYIRYNSNK